MSENVCVKIRTSRHINQTCRSVQPDYSLLQRREDPKRLFWVAFIYRLHIFPDGVRDVFPIRLCVCVRRINAASLHPSQFCLQHWTYWISANPATGRTAKTRRTPCRWETSRRATRRAWMRLSWSRWRWSRRAGVPEPRRRRHWTQVETERAACYTVQEGPGSAQEFSLLKGVFPPLLWGSDSEYLG